MEKVKQILKASVKNVWFNKKSYVFFAVFLFFVQSLISCVILFNHNNNQNELRFLEEEYQIEVSGSCHIYHAVLNNMTENQRAEVMAHWANQQEVYRTYTPVAVERVTSGGNLRFNMYLYFSSSLDSGRTPYSLYQDFLRTSLYKDSLSENVDVFETPLLLATRSTVTNNALTAGICFAIIGLGVVMFCLLFNTVVNHFKFSYGIYMTFGANFRKLLVNALCEMLVVNLVTFIPAFLFSLLITWLLTLRAGYGIHVQIYPMFLALLCSLIVTLISVTVVMKKLSRQTPNNLIRSVNNVGLITSPRRSEPIRQGSFPARTELLSIKRFRKYVVTLVLSTLIFAGAFCGGAFLMNAQSVKENMVRPQFSLSFPTGGILNGETLPSETGGEEPGETAETPETTSPETAEDSSSEEDLPLEYPQGITYIPEVRDNLYKIEGVEHILKTRSLAASLLKSHVLIPSNRLSLSAWFYGIKPDDEQKGYKAFGNVNYYLLDEEVIENIEYLGYTVTGDLNAVLTGENVIAISDSYNNARKFKLKVGDTVKIPSRSWKKMNYRLPVEMPSSLKGITEIYVTGFNFEYEEYTVGAILSDMPVSESFPVYLNAETFEKLTNTKAYFAEVELICDENLDETAIRSIQTRLYTLAQAYKMSVTNTSQDTLKVTTHMKNYPGIILYVSFLVLFVSVLIMILSQALFYQMRKQEFDIYLCLGADFRQVRKLFLFDAAFFAALSAVCYSLFACLFNYLFYKIANVNLGNATTRFSFGFPLWSYLVGLGVTVLSAFFSVMGSYLSYKKKASPVFTGKKVGKAEGEGPDRSAIFDSDAK